MSHVKIDTSTREPCTNKVALANQTWNSICDPISSWLEPILSCRTYADHHDVFTKLLAENSESELDIALSWEQCVHLSAPPSRYGWIRSFHAQAFDTTGSSSRLHNPTSFPVETREWKMDMGTEFDLVSHTLKDVRPSSKYEDSAYVLSYDLSHRTFTRRKVTSQPYGAFSRTYYKGCNFFMVHSYNRDKLESTIWGVREVETSGKPSSYRAATRFLSYPNRYGITPEGLCFIVCDILFLHNVQIPIDTTSGSTLSWYDLTDDGPWMNIITPDDNHIVLSPCFSDYDILYVCVLKYKHIDEDSRAYKWHTFRVSDGQSRQTRLTLLEDPPKMCPFYVDTLGRVMYCAKTVEDDKTKLSLVAEDQYTGCTRTRVLWMPDLSTERSSPIRDEPRAFYAHRGVAHVLFGYYMDAGFYLPIVLTTPLRELDHLHVERTTLCDMFVSFA